MSTAEIKAMGERIATLESMIAAMKGSVPSSKKADAPKRSNSANEFKNYVFTVAMKTEFDAFVEDAKKTAKDAGEKYNALKARNDFMKTLSDHAIEKLKTDFNAQKESADDTTEEKPVEAKPAKGKKSASASASTSASDAETTKKTVQKKGRGGSKKTEESDAGSASEAEAAPAAAAPAPAPEAAPAAAGGAGASAAPEEKPAEKKIVRRRAKVETSSDKE